MQNEHGCVNISIGRLYVVPLCVKWITMATTGQQCSLQECVFLLSAHYCYSAKYALIFNDYQERFLNSSIQSCKTVNHTVKHFEKMGSLEDSKSTGYPHLVSIEKNMRRSCKHSSYNYNAVCPKRLPGTQHFWSLFMANNERHRFFVIFILSYNFLLCFLLFSLHMPINCPNYAAQFNLGAQIEYLYIRQMFHIAKQHLQWVLRKTFQVASPTVQLPRKIM